MFDYVCFCRRTNRLSLVSVNCSNVFFFSLRLLFNTSITLASVDLGILFCKSFISFVNLFSCLLVFFFLYVANFIVSFLIVPLTSSNFVFGFASFLFQLFQLCFFLTVS